MKWKKALSLAITVICSLTALSGCGGVGTRTFRMNVAAPDGSVWRVAAETFAQIVEEKADGRWRVEVAYAHSDEEAALMLQRLLDGEAHFDLRSVADMQSQEARLSVFSLPWLFTDYQDADRRLFNGPGEEALFDVLRGIGFEPLALGENGFRQVTNDRRPITAPADFRGLTIRVSDNAPEAALFTQFGAVPVPLDWGETFDALQSGAVLGQQNTLDAIRAAQVDCVQRYLTVWNGAYDPLCLSVSAQLWETLTDEDKALFRAAAQEACAAEIAASRAQDSEILSKFRAGGVQVTALTEKQIQAFRAAAEPLYDVWRGEESLSALGYSG